MIYTNRVVKHCFARENERIHTQSFLCIPAWILDCLAKHKNTSIQTRRFNGEFRHAMDLLYGKSWSYKFTNDNYSVILKIEG